jgi:hypothetical protein
LPIPALAGALCSPLPSDAPGRSAFMLEV